MRDPTNLTPEALLGDARWLRGLARSLALERSRLDELVQDAWVAALRRAPHRSVAAPAAWIRRVLLNAAARDARREDLRAEREHGAARPEALPSAAELAERAEAQRVLAGAVLALDEPYRSTILWRYFGELSSEEIARRAGVPASTVRNRLRRGLDQLRSALERRTGPGGRSRGLALAGAAARWSTSTPFAGVIAMTLGKKVVAGVGVALLALLWLGLRDARDTPVELAASGAPTRSALEPPQDGPAPEVGSVESRSPATLPATEERPLAPGPETGSLRVHVTDNRSTPLVDIGIGIEPRESPSYRVAQPSFVRTNAEGDVLFEELAPGAYAVRIDRGIEQFTEVVAGQRAELVFRLGGMDVLGRVVDEHDVPVAGATIWSNHGLRAEGVPLTTTDARGEFRLAGCNGIHLQARKPGYAASLSHPLRNEVRMVLTSEAGALSGRVLDWTGAPLGDVLVTVERQSLQAGPGDSRLEEHRPVHVRSSADGSYRCDEVPRGSVVVAAIPTAPDRTLTSAHVEVGAVPVHVDLRLARGATLEGTLTDGGAPLANATVVVRCLEPQMPRAFWTRLIGMRFALSDADGTYRITGIVPGSIDVRVDTRAIPALQGEFGLHARSVRDGEIVRWDADCRSAERAPVEIRVEPALAPGLIGAWLIDLSGGPPGSPESRGRRTDESGSARFDALAAGRYTASVAVQYQTAELQESLFLPLLQRDFDRSESPLLLTIPPEMLRLHPVRGRLLDATGAGLHGRLVSVRRTDDFQWPATPAITTRDSGRFEFAGLPAGRYTLELRKAETITPLREFAVAGDRTEELGDVRVP